MEEHEALATILVAFVLESSDDEERVQQKRRKVWVKDWVSRRRQEGFYAKLLIELRSGEPELYRNFLRMDAEQFDQLLAMVTPHIKKKDTNMRESISAGERLVLTLRFLATGESFRSLQYLFRIPVSTISSIIPEVLDAIYKVLVNEYLQVNELTWFAHFYIRIEFHCRRREHQELGKLLPINSMNFGSSPTASEQSMENM